MKIQCRKCGHQWESRVEKPVSCPSCKQIKYWEPRKWGVKKDEQGRTTK